MLLQALQGLTHQTGNFQTSLVGFVTRMGRKDERKGNKKVRREVMKERMET
jgi:hypothetical protein